MKTPDCYICGSILVSSGFGNACEACKPVARICSTSAEEGVKYGIPGTDLADLKKALDFELRHSKRRTVIKAVERAIWKLEAAARSAS